MRIWMISATMLSLLTGSAFAQTSPAPQLWPSSTVKSKSAPTTASAHETRTPLPTMTGEQRYVPNTKYAPQTVMAPSATVTASPQIQTAAPLQTLNPNPLQADPNYKLNQVERLTKWDSNSLTTRRSVDRWEVTNGRTVLRDFGKDQAAAEEFVKVMRDLRPTDWGVIGTARTVVEYGLTNSQAQRPAFTPKTCVNIDLLSVRVELVRGVWVLRDDSNILLNFGASREDAEQAFGVMRKYAFNRLGQIGPMNSGVTYFFQQEEHSSSSKPQAQLAAIQAAYQEQQLVRTGIESTHQAMVGERVAFEPKSLEVRREKSDWVLAAGADILANFGGSEWTAKDALKLVREQRFTEFCRFNKDVCFFLINGNAPTKVPFSVQSTHFDREQLKVRSATGGKFGIYEGIGRQLFVCDTEKEASQLIEVLKHYGFDQKCQMGLSSVSCLKFLAKTAR